MCLNYAMTDEMKKVCNIKRENQNLTTVDIGKMTNHYCNTIKKWLEFGTIIGLCIYDKQHEKLLHDSNVANVGKEMCSKKVKCLETGQEFNSISEVERKSKDLFGIKISQKDVSLNCNNKTESAKGYHFIILY